MSLEARRGRDSGAWSRYHRQGSALEILVVNVRKMILTGNTTYNLLLGEGDLVFFPDAGGTQKPRDDLIEQALDAALETLDERGKVLVWVYRLAHDAEPMERCRAALTVGAFGDTAAFVVPQLVRALDQDDLVVREVVTALGMIGPAAKEAVPALEKLTNHDDKQIAERAKAALRQIRDNKR